METSTSPGSPRPRARPCAPSSPSSPEAEPREQLVDAVLGGHEHERRAAGLALDDQRRSRARARRRRRAPARPATVGTIAPSMSVAVRRGGLELQAGHRRERADVGGAEDVADLAERGRPNSVPGSTPSSAHSVAASSARRAAARRRSRSPTIGSTTPVTSRSASPAASTASASGSARARGHGEVDGAAEQRDSAVPAVPEPMFASSRSASSCRSVYSCSLRVLPGSG